MPLIAKEIETVRSAGEKSLMIDISTTLGPAALFVTMLLSTLLIAALVATVATWRASTLQKRQSHRGQGWLWLLAFMPALFVWGKASFSGGPSAAGGLAGSAEAGMMSFLSITSMQPAGAAHWSHQVALQPFGFVNSLALSLAIVLLTVLAVRLRELRAPR